MKLYKMSKDKLPYTIREKRIMVYSILLVVIIFAYIVPIGAFPGYYKTLASIEEAQATQINYPDPSVATHFNPDLLPIKESMKYTTMVDTNIIERKIREIAREKNFQWEDYLIRLAYCENDTLHPKRRGEIDENDRGIFQINSYWHPEVSDECAFDIRCATEWTMWRIESGHKNEWMCDDLI